MSFAEFLDRASGPERHLVVVNREAPDGVVGMLEATFGDQPIDVEERALSAHEEDTVLLVSEGEVLATSPLSALTDAVLFVNSDLYTTGDGELSELTVPDVLAGLADVPFTLRGYPESNTEKLLLVVISRLIERLAWARGEGRLRSSFQRLSRLDDEVGTRAVYERIADGGVTPHLYGVPDWRPPPALDVQIHGSHDDDLRRTWFVLFVPPEGPGADDAAALLAYESEPRLWEGFWTHRAGVVGDLERYVERRY